MTTASTGDEEPSPRHVAPQRFEDLEPVVAAYRDGTPVVVQVPQDRELRRRITDFLAGLALGSGGTLERVDSKVLLLTGPGVRRPPLP